MTDNIWHPLVMELHAWADLGRRALFWWRDDDAVTTTDNLAFLTELSHQFQIPVLLAVIPAFADEALGQHVSSHPLLSAAVHGWRHDNHAPEGQKSSEFGNTRDGAAVRRDLEAAQDQIDRLFARPAAQIFVPPWNRYDPRLVPLLEQMGFRILSASGAPGLNRISPDLRQLNVEIDPIDWRGTRSLVEPAKLIALITEKCRERRRAGAFHQPLGFMTHHLVHDQKVWLFTQALLGLIAQHRGSTWVSAQDLLR